MSLLGFTIIYNQLPTVLILQLPLMLHWIQSYRTKKVGQSGSSQGPISHTTRGHGGRVVTLSPPTSAAGVRSPTWP